MPYPTWLHPVPCRTPECPVQPVYPPPPPSVDITVELDSTRYQIVQDKDITVPLPGSVYVTFNPEGLTLRYRVRCDPTDPKVCEIA